MTVTGIKKGLDNNSPFFLLQIKINTILNYQYKLGGHHSMTEIKNSVFLSDTDASIVRLLSGLNFEDFQKQQDFLRSIKGNRETNAIVSGILELMDRVADIYEDSTGHSLTNRFDAVENFSKVLLLLEDATNKDYTLSELFINENVACIPSDDTFGYAHIRFGNILCTIANYYGIMITIGPVYVLRLTASDDREHAASLERISKKTFANLLKEASPLTQEEMEAAELCAGGKFDDLR